jgi:hypothetical protein
MRELAVWGGLLFNKNGQVRCIVATRTKKRAAELLNIPVSHLNNYFSVTGNSKELAIALAEPEVVFTETQPFTKIYERLS